MFLTLRHNQAISATDFIKNLKHFKFYILKKMYLYYPSLQMSEPQLRQFFSGRYYDQAHTPNFFQAKCVGSIAEYEWKNGIVDVRNICQKSDGKQTSIQGVATQRKKGTATFNLRFETGNSGIYRIILVKDLGCKNTMAIVMGRTRRYTWILSRQQDVPQKDIRKFIAQAGLNPNLFVYKK